MSAGRTNGLMMAAMLAFAGIACSLPSYAQDPSAEQARQAPDAAASAAANDPVAVPACASDPGKLGLERVVEIDTTGGGVYGSPNRHSNFLNDREVVLTFDDGPMRAYTRRVLAALEAHCTRATFFMVGRMAAADPAMVKEVIAAGHTVGTHTYSHKNLKPIGLLKGRSDFELGVAAVTKAAGDQPVAPFFRFPYLAESRPVAEYLKSRDTASFFIDVDSKDFQTRNSSIVLNRVMAQLAVTRKGIILMHDIQPSTAGMIRQLLDTLHEKGYKVVHMVPKWKATTVAGFDGPAGKAIADNAEKLKEKPMANRSVVWTMDPAASGTKSAAPKKPDARTQTGSITPAAATRPPKPGDELPWSKPAPAKAASTAPAKRPQRRDEELPWQARIFAN